MWSNYNDYPSQIKSFQVRINHNGYPSPILRIKDDNTTLVITYSPRKQGSHHMTNIFKITRSTDSRSHDLVKRQWKNKNKESLLSQNLKIRDLGKKLRHPAGLQNENSKEFVQEKIREKQKKAKEHQLKSLSKEQRRGIKTPEKNKWLPCKNINYCELFLRDECSCLFKLNIGLKNITKWGGLG